MIRIGIYIYNQAPTGEWLTVGKVINGVYTDYIQWYI